MNGSAQCLYWVADRKEIKMNRRSEKLDKYLNKQVEITFIDGYIVTGILEFDRPYGGLNFGSNKYSITHNSTHMFFRKSHVKSVKKVMDK